ncbi:MAG: NAD-dependent epimerase/dehydratase family protein [Nitrososphaerales archaeon]
MNPELDASLKGKSFLVTGGAGFIGSHIVERLLNAGAKVVAVDDLSNGKLVNLPAGNGRLEYVQRDVRVFEFESLGKIDGIFNEAARALVPSFIDPVTDLAVNTGGTIRILEYARKYDIKVVHASSGSIYGNPVKIPIADDHPLNPISPYGASKLASEVYCSMYHREYGLDVTMLRYFNVYGPRQSVNEEMGVIPIFVNRALRGDALRIFGDGKQTRDFLNVFDVVRANLLAYGSERGAGRTMNIGGGGFEISILDLAEEVMRLCDFHAPLIFAEPKPGDIRRLVADNTVARETIGYVPSVSLESGLQEYIKYARSQQPQRPSTAAGSGLPR